MMVAAALPVLIGFETLGLETGLWYLIKRQNQSAADAAAIAAAYEVLGGKADVAADLTPVASEAAAMNGYTGTAAQVLYPYSDGFVTNGVAVILQQSQIGLFGSIFLPSVTITTKAVAILSVLDDVCVLALSSTGTGLEVDNASHLDALGCAVASNSTSRNAIDIRNSAGLLSATTVVTQGEISLQGSPINPAAPPPEFSPTPHALIGAPNTGNPYAKILTHEFLSSQIPRIPVAVNTWPEGTTTVIPGHYNGGMSVGPTAAVDLEPGLYFVTEGDFVVASGATVTCTTCGGAKGVTIILTSTNASARAVGNVQISSGATVALHAPNFGTFSGLLFIQDPLAIPAGGNIPDNFFVGGSAMKLTGLLYFPTTTVRFQGNPSATCTLLIASQVETVGNAGFTASDCANAGLSSMPVVYTAALVE
jgi:hypothetical protein